MATVKEGVMRNWILIIALMFLVFGCASVEVSTTGWKVLDVKGLQQDHIAELKAAHAPSRAYKIGSVMLLETSCHAEYTTLFRSMQNIQGQVCGATAQADEVQSEVDINELLKAVILDKYLSEEDGGE